MKAHRDKMSFKVISTEVLYNFVCLSKQGHEL